MARLAYIVWQIVWGLPQTLLGFVVFLVNVRRPHFSHHGAVVTVWPSPSGLSLGPFLFLGKNPNAADGTLPCNAVDDRLLVHEYGHTIQSLILGPLYLVVIGLPSIVWMRMPALARRRQARNTSYYAFYTERWANHLGESVLKRPSMR